MKPSCLQCCQLAGLFAAPGRCFQNSVGFGCLCCCKSLGCLRQKHIVSFGLRIGTDLYPVRPSCLYCCHHHHLAAPGRCFQNSVGFGCLCCCKSLGCLRQKHIVSFGLRIGTDLYPVRPSCLCRHGFRHHVPYNSLCGLYSIFCCRIFLICGQRQHCRQC